MHRRQEIQQRMTERQQGAPGEPEIDGDPSQSELEANLGESELEGNPTELEDDIAEETGIDSTASEAGAVETAEEDEAFDADAAAGDEVVPPGIATPTRPSRPRLNLRRPARPAAVAPTVSEQAVRIDDRVSQAFVLITVGVFVLIFLNGFLLGRGGALAPLPSPSPIASESAAPSESPELSPSPGASESAAPSAEPSAGASPSAGG